MATADQTTTIVIFGASGDLTRRKLIPSLCSVFCKERLGPEVQIVGMARTNLTTDEYRESLSEGMDAFEEFSPETGDWNRFLSRIHYFCGDIDSADDMRSFEETLQGVESPGKPANRLYYLALAPSLYEPTILNLGPQVWPGLRVLGGGLSSKNPSARTWSQRRP